jgi:MoxR-like ATPase
LLKKERRIKTMEEVLAMAIAIQTKVPVILWGAPGTGKTSAIQAMGDQMGLPVEVVIASIREPSDFSGLPVIKDDGVHLEPPAWAKRLAQAGKGILFLDEISTAPPAVQAALLRVVLDKVVGDQPLPAEVAIVAAANPPEQAAGGWELSAPLANRFCHLDWELNPTEWVNGMVSGFKNKPMPELPEDWQDKIPQAKAAIAAFIRHRPHLLLQMPNEDSLVGKAWPSPRSWDMAARLLAAAESVDVGEEAEATLLSGCVGTGPALEFLSWKKALDLPDPEDLLEHHDQFQVPLRGDQAFAVLTAVVVAAVNKLTEKRWIAAWQILAQAAEQGAKDIAAAAAKALVEARKPNLPLPQKEVREFIPLLKKGGLI